MYVKNDSAAFNTAPRQQHVVNVALWQTIMKQTTKVRRGRLSSWVEGYGRPSDTILGNSFNFTVYHNLLALSRGAARRGDMGECPPVMDWKK